MRRRNLRSFKHGWQSSGSSAVLVGFLLIVVSSLWIVVNSGSSSASLPAVPEPSILQSINEESLRGAFSNYGLPVVPELSSFRLDEHSGRYQAHKDGSQFVLTLEPALQKLADDLLRRYRVPWGAIVAIEPTTGRVLAISGHSSNEPNGENVALRSGFPAASLFKLVTAAAAVEQTGAEGSTSIRYRGGNYSLGRHNYLPDQRRDNRQISLADALGKSCNPAFARLALQNIPESGVERYARFLGFDDHLPFEMGLQGNSLEIPNDTYGLTRAAAGFGAVRISPLYAAALTAAIANKGVMMQPRIVSHIRSADGSITYMAEPTELKQTLLASTADQLLEMMKETVATGTGRRQLGPLGRRIPIAGKTGTLSGDNPKGVYHWMVAAVPANNPELVIASLVIDPGTAQIRGSALAREFLEGYLKSSTK